MKKGCGCCGFMAAVFVGVIIGAVGLSVAGYHWLNHQALGDEPVKFERTWTEKDEARVAAKLFPPALAHTVGKESEHAIELSAAEANYLLEGVILKNTGARAELVLGDPELTLRFSAPVGGKSVWVKDHKYLNGELAGKFTGRNGDFEVELSSLRLGGFTCPDSLLSWAAYWLRGQLERQPFLQDERFKIIGLSHRGPKLELTVQIRGR